MDVMTRRIVRRFLGLLLIFALCLGALPGCHVPDSDPSATELSDNHHTPSIGATFGATLPEAELPALASAPLLTEPLSVVSWDSDRCERTSFCKYGEVESGFYGSAGYSLGYAERNDLDNWVVVCPYPDCQHINELQGCPASIGGEFVMRNERIYYSGNAGQYFALWQDGPEPGAFMFLASVSLDGTDTKLEHTFDISGISLGGGSGGSMYISSNYVIFCRRVLNDSGLYDTHIFILDEQGEHLIFDEDLDFQANGVGYNRALDYNTFGDRMFICPIYDPTWQLPFILTEDYTIEQVDLSGLPEEGAYLHDNIYRCFRPNDGYYDIDLDTREETKLEDAKLENSYAFIVLPNCILESTLMGYSSVSDRSAVQTHAMKLFDGQRWWDVELPEELQSVGSNKYLDVEAVTSDRILLCLRDMNNPYDLGRIYYQIYLGTDYPGVEYAGTVEYQEHASG